MRHIKQRKNECFPTVLAMLTGIDVNKILAESQTINPVYHSWSDAMRLGDQTNITMAYRALARKYAPYLIDHVEPFNTEKLINGKLYMSYQDYAQQTKLGRGALILGSRYRSTPAAHIAAYENGLIYCSDCDSAVTSREYWIFLSEKTPLCPIRVVPEF